VTKVKHKQTEHHRISNHSRNWSLLSILFQNQTLIICTSNARQSREQCNFQFFIDWPSSLRVIPGLVKTEPMGIIGSGFFTCQTLSCHRTESGTALKELNSDTHHRKSPTLRLFLDSTHGRRNTVHYKHSPMLLSKTAK